METKGVIECLRISRASSYRTYEEWKRGWKWSWLGDLESSYRTYEEWKLEFGVGLITGIEEFLPYLWGMETSDAIDKFTSAF